ncbi:ATP-dependent RNA helicase dhx29 [Bulinus truncatus]|nr:ATP-dependent RNA helicase dhx29 [Bulinus truncatus]
MGVRAHNTVVMGVRAHNTVVMGVREHNTVVMGVREHNTVVMGVREHNKVVMGVRAHNTVVMGVREHNTVVMGVREHNTVVMGVRAPNTDVMGVREHNTVVMGVREHNTVLMGVRAHNTVVMGVRARNTVVMGVREHNTVLIGVREHNTVVMGVRAHNTVVMGVRARNTVVMGVREHNTVVMGVRAHNTVVMGVRAHNTVVMGVREHNTVVMEVREHNTVVVGVREHNTVLMGVREHNTVVMGVRKHNTVVMGVRENNTVVMGVREHNTAVMGVRAHNTVVMGVRAHNTVVMGVREHNTVVMGVREHNTVVMGVRAHNTVVMGVREHNTVVMGVRAHNTVVIGGQLNEISPIKSSDTPEYVKKRKRIFDSTYLQKMLLKKHSTAEFQELLCSRQLLPVFQFRDQVLSAIGAHSVVIIAGETGSGKSTQIPQFVLEDSIDRGISNMYVVCTQPRRISAVSLAARVSAEIGESSSDQKEAFIGYQIRFDSHKGPNTRLLYSTTGVVLRQLQGDVDLKGISHLIIDEVHERSVESDYLLIVVKEILTRRSDLKVILMSATVDCDKFSAYFHHCPIINIPGKTYPVKVYYLEDVIEKTGYVVDDDSPYVLNPKYLIQESEATVDVTKKGGDSSKQLLTWTKEDISRIDKDLLNYLESSPTYADINGAVLIFLPGFSDILELYEMLTSHRQFSNETKYRIYALHSLLSSKDQVESFTVPPPSIRKIVIATNIAETGITIPDVVFIIDSGKAKENRYIETSRISSLEEIFISKANCKQRTGRAGRVREGYCFRLYTQEHYHGFKPFTTPELLRVPLEEICLNIMKCQYGKPCEFLNQALDPPNLSAVSRAMSLLKEVGACQFDECSLTPLGHHLAALPVDIRIGKMLLLGSIFGCLEEIGFIAPSSALQNRNAWVPFTNHVQSLFLTNGRLIQVVMTGNLHKFLANFYQIQ